MGWSIIPLLIVAMVGGLVKNCQGSNGSTSCARPSITRLNFKYFVSILNGTNRTLSCEIHSDTPLKQNPIWHRDFPSYLPSEHTVNNSSCSLSRNETCVLSNLTLIHVARNHYEGNYSLTAENDCGNASVYVYINIIVPQHCTNHYSQPPKMLTPPPSVVQAVEGYSASVEATFEGKIDTNLGAYWCITTEDKSYHCYSSSDHDDNYSVTVDDCPPDDPYCCNFTVTFTITSLTHNLSMAHLTSRVFWLQNASAFEPGNSVLVLYVHPVLHKWLPPSSKCVEFYEGQSTEFTCIYTASTNPSVTITTWTYNGETLQHNTSHYKMLTEYGTDPINANHVSSRLVFSNVIANNTGTYTCQCGYNQNIISNNQEIVSNTTSFCLRVNATSPPPANTGKSKQQPYIKYVFFGGISATTLVIIVISVMVFIYCLKKQKYSKKQESMTIQDNNNEKTALLEGNKRNRSMSNFAADDNISSTSITHLIISCNHSVNDEHGLMNTPKNKGMNLEISPSGSTKSTSQAGQYHGFISGQDTSAPTITVIPSHSKASRQHGDLVTGSTAGTNTADVVVHESDRIHNKLLNPQKWSTSQPATLESCTQDGSNTAIDSKPGLFLFPPNQPAICEPEGPRPTEPAKCATVSTESITTEGLDDHNRILNLIAPDVTALANMEVLLPFLQQHQLVTVDEESYLNSLMYSTRQKAQWLLSYIRHKGVGSLQLLLCCLHLAHEHKGHKELAEKLKKHMQTTGIHCEDFCSDDCKLRLHK